MLRNTPLHYGTSGGRCIVIELLVAFGADLECISSDGWSPLIVAAMWLKPDAVRLLLALNADMTKAADRGWDVSQIDNEEFKQHVLEHSKKRVRISDRYFTLDSTIFRFSYSRDRNENKFDSKH